MISSTKVAVRFEDVTKVYTGGLFRRGVRALDGVSLSIEAGEVFGMVGPNRAGKTTLVKILLSICRPTSGRIMRLGLHWKDRRTMARIGYVHESQAFPRYLSARALLEFYGALSFQAKPVVRRRAGELLERFGLADRSREPIARFSKGMLQRLALCQSLVNDPELLVLDEPSEGMDLMARRVLDEVIAERKQQGRTAILVSHHLNDVQRLCDRVAVIRSGKVAFLGRVAELVGAQSGSSNPSLIADWPEQEPVDRSLEEVLEPLYAGAKQ
jgi:ABC-2 type transport system ATP-binding protein